MATTAQALTVDPDQQAILKELAARELRSPEMLLRDALEAYFQRSAAAEASEAENTDQAQPELYADEPMTDEQIIAESDARYEHYKQTGLHVTWEEADAWLAKLQAGEKVPPPECHT